MAAAPDAPVRAGSQDRGCSRTGFSAAIGAQRDPSFAELARSFARDLPGDVHVQLYASPAHTRTFGWRFDGEAPSACCLGLAASVQLDTCLAIYRAVANGALQ